MPQTVRGKSRRGCRHSAGRRDPEGRQETLLGRKERCPEKAGTEVLSQRVGWTPCSCRGIGAILQTPATGLSKALTWCPTPGTETSPLW